MARWTFDDIPCQAGRTALVTGANSGLGFESARQLALKGVLDDHRAANAFGEAFGQREQITLRQSADGWRVWGSWRTGGARGMLAERVEHGHPGGVAAQQNQGASVGGVRSECPSGWRATTAAHCRSAAISSSVGSASWPTPIANTTEEGASPTSDVSTSRSSGSTTGPRRVEGSARSVYSTSEPSRVRGRPWSSPCRSKF
jgi:hypothetical protein